MSYRVDTEIEIKIEEGLTTTYIISSQHRITGNPNKTIWSVNYDDEVKCFTQSITSKWFKNNYGWGLKVLIQFYRILDITMRMKP